MQGFEEFPFTLQELHIQFFNEIFKVKKGNNSFKIFKKKNCRRNI